MPLSSDPTQTRLAVQRLHELPPMSPVVTQFLQAVEDNHLEVRQLARIIDQDPGLAARLVGVANSPYFGYPEPVISTEEAIFKVLGLNTARNLALGIVLSGAFSTERCPAFHLDCHWASALITADLAHAFAQESGIGVPPGEAYLCGLLHTIGLLALVHLFPGPMDALFRELGQETVAPSALVAAERARLGSDHLETGGWLARKWHLPQSMVSTIENYLAPTDKQPAVVWLVHTAALLAPQLLDDPEQRGSIPGSDALAAFGISRSRVGEMVAAIAERSQEIAAMSGVLAG